MSLDRLDSTRLDTTHSQARVIIKLKLDITPHVGIEERLHSNVQLMEIYMYMLNMTMAMTITTIQIIWISAAGRSGVKLSGGGHANSFQLIHCLVQVYV